MKLTPRQIAVLAECVEDASSLIGGLHPDDFADAEAFINEARAAIAVLRGENRASRRPGGIFRANSKETS